MCVCVCVRACELCQPMHYVSDGTCKYRKTNVCVFWHAVHLERGSQMFRALYWNNGVFKASQRPYCVLSRARVLLCVRASAYEGHSWLCSKKCVYVNVWNASFCSRVTGWNKAVHSEHQEDIFLLQFNSAVLVVFVITQPLNSHSAILSNVFALQSNKAWVWIDQEVLRKWFAHSVTSR